MWFEIRHYSLYKYAAMHVFNMVKYLRTLNDDIISAVVEPKIQRHGDTIHSESIILAMLCDDSLRQSAIEKIMQSRRKNGNNTMRKLHYIPKNELPGQLLSFNDRLV